MQKLDEQLHLQPFGTKEFRDALGAFATGVTVVTTRGKEPYGMTANAFSSLSLDPPMVLVCIVTGTHGCDSIRENGIFAVNVLTEAQEPLSRYFASRDRPRTAAAFADVAHRSEATGAPILDGSAAYLDCRLAGQHEAGDHTILIGEVLALGVDKSARPLLYFGGGYQRLTME